MAVVISDISSKTWSISIAAPGEIVADAEDIKQCIALIVFTRKFSVPYNPEFGCLWYNYIDQPINAAGPLMLREIRNSIARWEDRVTILNSSFSIDGSTLHLSIEVQPNFTRQTDPVSSIFITFELSTLTGLLIAT